MNDTIPTKPPIIRRLWFVIVGTLLLFPALLILATGTAYRRWESGWQPISHKARYIWLGALVCWLILATAKAVLSPGGIEQQWADSADPRLASATKPKPTKAPEAKTTTEPTEQQDRSEPTAEDSTPDMRIAVGGQYRDITITADDDAPFIIERVVLNNRDGDKMCDFGPVEITEDMTPNQKLQAELRTQLPTKEMQRGDSIQFGSTCGQTLRVTVHTNRGVSEYQIIQQ